MLTRRRKQVTLQRAMAFVKRLSTISLHVMPNASVGILAANRATMHVSLNVCVDILSSSPRPQLPTLPEQNSSPPQSHCRQSAYSSIVISGVFFVLVDAPTLFTLQHEAVICCYIKF